MILVWLALLAADAQASVPASVSTQARPAASIIVPAGTAVRLVTVGMVDSRSVVQGQRFGLRVDEDVTVGSQVVIPRGAEAVGEVEAVSGKGAFGMAARLVLRPLFIDIAGERVNLVGFTKERGKDGTAAAAITTAITPFGLLITGKSATVPTGSLLLGRIRSDVTLPIEAAASPAAPSATTNGVKQ